MRAVRGLAAAVLVALVVVVVLVASVTAVTAPGAGAQTSERIARYDADLTIEAGGGLLVRETIAYDFGVIPRRGILRDIPVRVDYPPRENYDRVYPVDVLSVTASEGTPAQYEVDEEGSNLRIKIGDPDRTITGAHTYEITYRVRGAFNGFPDHDELVWNAIGGEWTVPIEAANVTVHAPTDIERVGCAAGLYGSTLSCGSAEVTGSTATFTAPAFGLGPYQGMTVTVGLPKGAVPEPEPIVEERFNLASAFRATAATTGISGVLLAVVVAGFALLLFFVGRDRRYRGSAVDAAFAPRVDHGPGTEERVPFSAEDETPVEFVPPDGLRPGQVGALVDFTANPLDVTATIVDLAVRGYLTIEETEERGLFRAGDWKLTETGSVPERKAGTTTGTGKSGDDGDLLQYERTLLAGLFRDGPEVQLSELHNTFATRMASVQQALLDDALQRKWFAGRPGTTRALWVGLGLLLVVVGVAFTVVLAISTHAALVGIPVVIGGLLVAIGAKWMPHRTAKGYAVLRRVDGFRRFIDESEKERARFAERKNLFSEYLPYAVVFGATKKWANAFAGLDNEPPDTSGWYVGRHPFTYAAFSGAIDGFSVSTAGTLTSAPSTSGSSGFSGGGFSGGGGGGGGGGSW